jgi:four helix bundle protein
MMDYEKLDVYKLSLQFIADTLKLRDINHKGKGELVEQFKRASLSIALNIAEGAGKFKKPDKQRFYGIARGSAMECAALIDIFLIVQSLDSTEANRAKNQLTQIVKILSALCLS